MALTVKSSKTDAPGRLKVATFGDTKVGKAQPVSQPVLTPHGWIPIGDVERGDAVIGVIGKAVEVIDVFPQGTKKVFQVNFGDRTNTLCCAEHLWTVRRGGAETYETQPLALVMETLERVGCESARLRYIPMTAAVEFAATQTLPIPAYIFGLLLGDGGFRNMSPDWSNPEEDLIERMRAFVATMDLQMQQAPSSKARTCPNFRLSNPTGKGRPNPLKQILQSLDVYGHLSKDKFVPEMYLRASVADRLALLRGLMDTAGDVGINGISTIYNTSSKRLKDNVVDLVQSLGGTARWSSRDPKYVYKNETHYGHEAFRVNVRLPVGMCPVSSAKHLARLRNEDSFEHRHPPTRVFDSVEEYGDEECVCIKVANEDGLYLTNDYIVTHNTRFAGTFPNPFFFSFGVESGVASLTSMPTESHYVSINDTQETAEALRLFVGTYKEKGYKTAVVDTVTLLGRMVQMELTKHGERQMEFKDWSKFLSYFLTIRDTLHACDVHVVWVFHVDNVTSGDVIIKRAPKLAGASLKEILQTVGIICYQDKIEIDARRNEKGEVVAPRRTAYRLFTRCPETERPHFEVGSWYDDVLTEPVYYPSFEALAKHLAPRDKDGKPVGQQHISI